MLVQQEFAETKLITKFAGFQLRVYRDDYGKENVVLWTENIDRTKPVLVRVHSECITGDLFGSLHCDCGQQLAKSLQMIKEEGGVLIYLRQEGRGIGLLEKIKSYQLQSKGYDTFEANILLGHNPDPRSYEMIKQFLDDLSIIRIRLLTNNPSKVSDIAKLGIEIVDRIPLITKPNKHNKAYMETKRKKFQHFLQNSSQNYFYQFQIDKAEKMNSIIEFIKERKKDPLLKISVGITANHFTFENENEIQRINSIINFCENQVDLIPIIHFSFINSFNILKDVEDIKKTWPSINRIQLNDLPNLDINLLEKFSEIFSVDIPLSDENFDLIHNARFRDIVQKSHCFIVLDNSKGNGLKENKSAYKTKIDTLLSYGINNITLCGGFGPDQLDTYFELRRYYRINFSVDAETKLKTQDQVDIEKVKTYLWQLFRFDEPKQNRIEQTREFLKKYCRTEWEKVKVNGYEFSIHPQVFHAGHFPSTSWFASELCSLLKNNSNFCEVGCGSGVISCLVALSHPKLHVTATDINPHASENTKLNATSLSLTPRITVYTGDVLDSLGNEDRFDSIFWALPFGFLDPGTSITLEEAQVFDPGYRAIRKFLQTAKKHLQPNGKLYLGFSSDLGHYELLNQITQEVNANIRVVAKTVIQEKAALQFEILELSYN